MKWTRTQAAQLCLELFPQRQDAPGSGTPVVLKLSGPPSRPEGSLKHGLLGLSSRVSSSED